MRYLKNIKKRLVLLLLVACCLSLSGCVMVGGLILAGGNDLVPKEEIIVYVQEHEEELSSFPYESYAKEFDYSYKDDKKAQYFRNLLGRDTIVQDARRYNADILQFYCGGSGNVTASTYCGFYYSEKDEPFAFEFKSEARFAQTAEGVYEWKSEDQGRSLYTERILPNWFYYYQVWL